MHAWTPARSSPRRALLLALAGAALLALAPAWWPAPASAAAPALSLDPARGPCSTRPVVGGSGFPPGARIAIFSQRTSPPGEKAASQIGEALANSRGAFAEMMLVVNGDCIDLDGRTPEGTRYTFTAAVAGTDNGPTASAIFTIDRGAPGVRRCFPETGQCVQGRFLAYWRSQGLDLGDTGTSERESLALFGYPISDEVSQRLEDGNEYWVQYFERVRMEWHPEHRAPYDVLLGQFGRAILAGVPTAPTAPVPPSTRQGYVHFAVTGHNVAPDFALFWSRNGGLAVFGYPLSEEFEQTLEDGKPYIVQYFERARFERHPAQEGTPYNVQLGQFGRLILGPTGGPGAP